MSNPLATVIATALEAARVVDEERIRQIVRDELAAFQPAQRSGWLTPPAAAKAFGIGVKRVRAMIDSGVVVTRPRNLEPGKARQLKLEVNVASLEAALRSPAGRPTTDPGAPTNGKVSAEAPWASETLVKRAARGSA